MPKTLWPSSGWKFTMGELLLFSGGRQRAKEEVVVTYS
jgi:hypothetical protein